MAGIKFPIEPDEKTGRLKLSFGDEMMSEAIKLILFTQKGERLMRPEFGSNLRQYAFENIDVTTTDGITNEIIDSLDRWEPRIEGLIVSTQEDGYEDVGLAVNISYTTQTNPTRQDLGVVLGLKDGENI